MSRNSHPNQPAAPAAHGAGLGLDEIRAQFPALGRVHHGAPVAYFDGPGGTQVPAKVVDDMRDYLLHHNANTHWVYPTSVETDGLITAARAAVADLLGASPQEIAFGQNMTSLTFHLARSLGRRLGPGAEILLTELDHHANVAPWRALEKERGVTVKLAKVEAGRLVLDLEDLAAQMGPRTRVVAVGAASNAVGTINDVARIAALAHERGALVFVDAVHYTPHRLVDVRALGCDFLACSAYKFYGPHIGILWGRHDLVLGLDVPKLEPAPDTAPERLETGTQSHESMVGAMAAVDFLAGLARGAGRRERLAHTYASMEAHEAALFGRLWQGLAAIDGVRLYGVEPRLARTPTVAFTVRGLPSVEVARRLADEGVFVSNGDFYATTVVRNLGLERDGLVRAGLAIYTSEEEIERLVEGVRGLV